MKALREMAERRKQLEEQLSAYLDDELSPRQRAKLEAILAKDADARALLSELQALRSALKSLPRARAADDLVANVQARMERRALLGDETSRPAEKPVGMSAGGRWVAAAAIVLMTGVAGYVTWIIRSPDHPASPHPQFATLEGAHEAPQAQSSETESALASARESADEAIAPAAPTLSVAMSPPDDSDSVSAGESAAGSTALLHDPISTSRPSEPEVLWIACADDRSRQLLLHEITAYADDSTPTSEALSEALSSMGAVQLSSEPPPLPSDATITEHEITVADNLARDLLIRRLSGLQSSKADFAAARSAKSMLPADTQLSPDEYSYALRARRGVPETQPTEPIRPNAATEYMVSADHAGQDGIAASGPAEAPTGPSLLRLSIVVATPSTSRPTQPSASTLPASQPAADSDSLP